MAVFGIGERHFERALLRSRVESKLPLVSPPQALSRWLVLLPLVIGFVVEAALGFRLWAQLTSQDVQSGFLAWGFTATGVLVGPFQSFEPSTPLKQTGIVEIATLVAMQAYFIAAVCAFIVLIAVRSAVRALLKRRNF